ncbi:MAG TPA: ATP-binding protein [Williamwhitmania sp.]|nr:ATP-binding protein [Williamwhitmania sp.]
MAIKIITTAQSVNKVKVLVYGFAGVGKTRLCATTKNNLILSAEGGLLSLADEDIPVIEIKSMENLNEAFMFLKDSKEAAAYETVSLDSLSDIAEVCLSTAKAETKDPRQAYGELGDKMSVIIRAFRDLPNHNIYFTAKVKRLTDDFGVTQHVPSMPGNMLVTALPYFFDEVLALRTAQTEEGTPYSYLQTSRDLYWEAKDRSGKLDFMEEPNLEKLFNKIRGNKTNGKGGEKKVVEKAAVEKETTTAKK